MRTVQPSPLSPDPWATDAQAFGAAIRAARTASGMSIADAAASVGISKQTLSDLETARASVGLSIALKAARQFGVAVLLLSPEEREVVRHSVIRARQSSVAQGGVDRG